MIEDKAFIISDPGLKLHFENNKFSNIKYLYWNEETRYSSNDITIKIKAVPAIHAKKKILSSRIGNGNGYVLKIGKRNSEYNIYITGDSVYRKDINKYLEDTKINLIIANAGSAMIGYSILSKIIGRVTNNSNDIKKMANGLNPEILIPVHWGTFSHYSEDINNDLFNTNRNIRHVEPGEKVKLI